MILRDKESLFPENFPAWKDLSFFAGNPKVASDLVADDNADALRVRKVDPCG
jgi:hypothetical protein